MIESIDTIRKAIKEVLPLLTRYTREGETPEEIYSDEHNFLLYENKTECAQICTEIGLIGNKALLDYKEIVDWEKLYDDEIAVNPYYGAYITTYGVLLDMATGWGDEETPDW